MLIRTKELFPPEVPIGDTGGLAWGGGESVRSIEPSNEIPCSKKFSDEKLNARRRHGI